MSAALKNAVGYVVACSLLLATGDSLAIGIPSPPPTLTLEQQAQRFHECEGCTFVALPNVEPRIQSRAVIGFYAKYTHFVKVKWPNKKIQKVPDPAAFVRSFVILMAVHVLSSILLALGILVVIEVRQRSDSAPGGPLLRICRMVKLVPELESTLLETVGDMQHELFECTEQREYARAALIVLNGYRAFACALLLWLLLRCKDEAASSVKGFFRSS